MADEYIWDIVDGQLCLNSVGFPLEPSNYDAKYHWRIDKYTNNGLPYTGYMPTIKAYPELSRSRTKYFDLLDRVSVYSEPHGMRDVIFPITEMKIPLNSPENIKMVLGTNKQVSLTSVRNEFNEEIKKVLTKIPKISNVLESAKDNALELIKAGTSGYVTLNQGDDGYVKELIISDNPDYKNAANVWVWNINGLAFFKGGYDPENGKPAPGTEVPVAITADGQIVADFITAGLLSADRIRGGRLKIGGIDYPTGGESTGEDVKNALSVFSDDENYEMRLSGGVISWYSDIDGNHKQIAHIDSYASAGGTNDPQLAIVANTGIILNPRNLGIIPPNADYYVQCAKNEEIRVLTNGPGEGVEEFEYIKSIELDDDGKIKSIDKNKLYFKNRRVVHGFIIGDYNYS